MWWGVCVIGGGVCGVIMVRGVYYGDMMGGLNIDLIIINADRTKYTYYTQVCLAS